MEKTKILEKIFLLSLILTLCFGCTKLLFENTVPKEGEIVKVLPEFLSGKFLKKGEKIYYEIERINKKHCIIYSYDWIHKDSINSLVESFNNDSTYAEFRGSTLLIKDKDTSQIINLRMENDIYYTEKAPKYEINLEKGYFIDDFNKMNEKKALLKSYNNKYFLNILDEEEKWFEVWLEEKNNNLFIRNSFIADTSFANNLKYYKGLSTIKKIKDKTYLVNPSDKELFDLLEEPFLFYEETWIRVDDSQQMNWMWKVIAIAFLLLFIIIIVIRKRNHKTV